MINIAELLKDAPKGMKLYSPLFGEVKFVGIDKQSVYPIDVKDCKGNRKSFTEFGVYFADHPDGECLLFPSKDCRTWEGWKASIECEFKVGDWVVRKDGEPFYGGNYAEQITLIEGDGFLKCIWFSSGTWLRDNDIRFWSVADIKDGDVLVTTKIRSCPFIYRKVSYNNDLAYYYAGIDGNGDFSEGCLKRTLCHFGPVSDVSPATKDERERLFKKMKEAGYEWDEKEKELCRIINPKFKVGDNIKTGNTVETIAEVGHAIRRYYCESGRTIWFENQDLWHLAPKPHYDIANFHAGMPVLVRDYNNSQWSYVQFSHLIAERNVGEGGFKFNACGIPYIQCIPLNENTKHLIGTTDMCDEQYINW